MLYVCMCEKLGLSCSMRVCVYLGQLPPIPYTHTQYIPTHTIYTDKPIHPIQVAILLSIRLRGADIPPLLKHGLRFFGTTPMITPLSPTNTPGVLTWSPRHLRHQVVIYSPQEMQRHSPHPSAPHQEPLLAAGWCSPSHYLGLANVPFQTSQTSHREGTHSSRRGLGIAASGRRSRGLRRNLDSARSVGMCRTQLGQRGCQ